MPGPALLIVSGWFVVFERPRASLGRRQYGLLHSGHCTGGASCRGLHSCPQRLHTLKFIALSIVHDHSLVLRISRSLRETALMRQSYRDCRVRQVINSPDHRPTSGVPLRQEFAQPQRHPGDGRRFPCSHNVTVAPLTPRSARIAARDSRWRRALSQSTN
jgi:hypothetical protein